MRLFKEKMAWAAPIAVILIIALFSVNLFAQGDPKVRNLPVTLIVNDSGQHVDTIKAALDKMVEGIDGKEPVIAFTVENEADIERLFADKEYYAAFVVPKGYNDSIENAMANNAPAQLKIYLNQGYNMQGSNVAKNALNGFVAQMNAQYSQSFITQIGDKKIDAAQATVLVNPIVVEEEIYNEITASTANGSAPVLMAVPAWVGALIGGFVIFLTTSSILKRELLTRKQTFELMLGQILFGVIIALFSGFTVATLGYVAGINMPSYWLVALFVSFAAFCFFLLVSAITEWVGKPAITLLMVVMLLGMGVLMTPMEMLPDFFVNFIRPWIPLRFASEGLRDIFYFGSGFYTGSSFNTILGIGIVSFIVYGISIFKPVKAKQ